jgi:hypothetical protein
MKQENRVLARMGARELTPREIENVAGGLHTLTACTIIVLKGTVDGDANECNR